MKDINLFTLRGNPPGIMMALKTPCKVSMPFNPLPGAKHPPALEFVALWDTGATGCVITKDVANKLGLSPVSKTKAFHADGESIVNVYLINLILPHGVAFSFIPVTEGKLTGTDLLIGMDIITRGDFIITNTGGETVFRFRVPSTGVLDFEVDGKADVPKPGKIPFSAIGRNADCPCGSGKKYKRCHGLQGSPPLPTTPSTPS